MSHFQAIGRQNIDQDTVDSPAEQAKPETEITAPPSSFLGQQIESLRKLRCEFEGATELSARSEIVASILKFIAFDNKCLRRATLKMLSKMGAGILPGLLDALENNVGPDERAALLLSAGFLLRYAPEQEKRAFVRKINASLLDPDIKARTAAAAALRLINSTYAQSKLLEHYLRSQEAQTLHELCMCQNPGLIEPFVKQESLESIGQISPLYGLALNGSWLAEWLDSKHGEALALRFGAIDRSSLTLCRMREQAIDEAQRLLKVFGAVTFPMLNRLLDTPEKGRELLVEEWNARRSDLAWTILPDEFTERRLAKPLMLGDSRDALIDQSILFAAMRQLDLSNIEIRAGLNPFSEEANCQAPGFLFYLSWHGFRQLLSEKVRVAQSLLPAESSIQLISRAALDFLSIESETREEQRLELLQCAYARWRAAGRILVVGSEECLIKDDLQSEIEREIPNGSGPASILLLKNRKIWKYGALELEAMRSSANLIEQFSELKRWEDLSKCAKAALALEAYQLCADDSKTKLNRKRSLLRSFVRLSRDEQVALGKGLPSIGLELQTGSVRVQDLQGLKEAFKHFGINSPRRPEFMGVLEAALPPAASAQVAARAACLVHKAFLDTHNSNDLTMHISIGADLGDDIKYLLFPLYVAHYATVLPRCHGEKWRSGLAKLMSKGLVCRNDDCEALIDGSKPPIIRTEVRFLPCSNDHESLAELVQFLQVSAGCILEAHKSGDDPQDAAGRRWDEFKTNITQISGEYGDTAVNLLDANWYESSGNFRDRALFCMLHIVSAMEAFNKSTAQTPDAFAKFSEDCRLALRRFRSSVFGSL